MFLRDAKLVVMAGLGVFVYGTLRPGGWNHERWLAPVLAGVCRPAQLAGMALHHHGGLPYVVPAETGRLVTGDVATLVADGYGEALAHLDRLEDTAGDHYRRVTAETVDGETVWVWVAGGRVSRELGPDTLVEHGDWLRVAGAA